MLPIVSELKRSPEETMARDIDILIEKVRSRKPAVAIEQLKVRHPDVDDDGLWFFRLPAEKKGIQVESSTGAAPFLVERDDAVVIEDASVDAAAAAIIEYLSKKAANQTSVPTSPFGRRGTS